MKKIICRGPFLSHAGYGTDARFVLRVLRKLVDRNEIDLFAVNTGWGASSWLHDDNDERHFIDGLIAKTHVALQNKEKFDVSIQVTIPNEWEYMAPINIGVTAGIETNKVSPIWLEKCQVVNKIIVHSQHSKEVFENTSVRIKNTESFIRCQTPIDVVPFPARLFEKDENFNLQLDTDFNFLTVAQWGPRKNLEGTIGGFVEEFHDNENVGLVVKANLRNDSRVDREYFHERLEALLSRFPNRKCAVYALHGYLTEQELSALYQHPKIKAFTLMSRGEGTGLPMFDAVCYGMPVVAPLWSGPVDYLYCPVRDGKKKIMKPMCAKVEYSIQPVEKEAIWQGVIDPDMKWCYADNNSYRQALRNMYLAYGSYKEKAEKLRKYVLKNFEEVEVENRLIESLGFAESKSSIPPETSSDVIEISEDD